MKNNRYKELSTTVAIAAISIVLFFGITIQGNVFAADSKTIEIINKTPEDFIFKEVSNRQDVKIVVEPPKEIPKGSGAGFSVAKGDSEKAYHLNVKYYVGEEGSEDVIGFGFKSKSNTDSWNDFNCFTDTPDNIKGEYDHCNGGTTTFTFSSK